MPASEAVPASMAYQKRIFQKKYASERGCAGKYGIPIEKISELVCLSTSLGS